MQRPKASLVAMNKNQAPVCWSWRTSNSLVIKGCVLKQRIVEMPYKEALKWENRGAFAGTKEKIIVEITEIISNQT